VPGHPPLATPLELAGIVCCTPQLRYLEFEYYLNDIENTYFVSSIRLANLICLSVRISNVDFVDFKQFIKSMNWKLKKLSIISQSNDITYLNASRWKELIQHYFPQLNKFYLTYFNHRYNDNHQDEISNELNEFYSSFWIERKWVLNIEIHGIYIKFRIHPFKYIESVFSLEDQFYFSLFLE
jgi:hypothetical protein